MTYIVQGTPWKPAGSITVTKGNRRAALEAAVGLLEQGIPNVTITGDGQTCTATEFALAMEWPDFKT